MAEWILYAILVVGIMLGYVAWNHKDGVRTYFKSFYERYSLLLRISLSVAFIIVIIGYANFLHQTEPKLALSELAKFVVSGLVVVGLFYSILAYEFGVKKSKLDRRVQKGQSTFNILSTWYNSPLIDYSKVIDSFEKSDKYSLLKNNIEEFEKYFEDVDKSIELRNAYRGIFNHFEIISAGIKEEVIDETFVKRYFKDIFFAYYEDWIAFIVRRRQKNPDAFLEFTTLVENWRKEK